MSKIHKNLLQFARKRIKNGQSNYICFALDDSIFNMPYRKREKFYKARYEIKKHIMTLLLERGTLEAWLEKVVPWRQIANNRNKVRLTRLAWIDWLIEQWKDV